MTLNSKTSAGKRVALKPYLRGVCLPALAAKSPYFSLKAIQMHLAAHAVPWRPAVLRSYLSKAMHDGLIHDAGRGWYSSLAVSFTLNTEPVDRVADVVAQQFPLLDFSCWSTAQVNAWMHHLLGKFVVFVHVERDAMESVYHRLKDLGWNAYLNPTRQEAAKTFEPGENTVVLRPSVQRAPVQGHFAGIEKVLVDLVMENQALNIMDVGEFQGMAGSLVSSARINIEVEIINFYATFHCPKLPDQTLD